MKNDLFEQRIIIVTGAASQAIFQSILHVIHNAWHGQGLLMYISVYNSAYFLVIFWTLNYTLKTGWT